MDGTLVDTEPCWMEAEFALARRHGASWSHEQALQLVGNDLLVSGEYMRTQMSLDLTPREIVEELIDSVVQQVRRSVPWRPGARELLSALRESGVPCALVTMSWSRLVEPIVAALPAHTFAAVVTGDLVERGKPDPAAYLLAANQLGLPPDQCLAIEDSATGVASATAAGCPTLCVPAHVDVPPQPGLVLCTSLAGLDIAALRQFHAGILDER